MTKYWIWLTSRKNVGPVTIQKLMRHFPTPEAVYDAGPEELKLVEGLNAREAKGLSDHSMDAADRILEDCFVRNIGILTWQDAQYPERLRNIPDPPAVLYYRGRLPDFDSEPAIAVVGTRKATQYGILTAHRLGYQIGLDGGLLVSGLAAGIDGSAMSGALSAGSRVVGVLGCGVDVVYPRQNRALFQDVLFQGCLLSEYPPGTEPAAGHFPVRNRIISGLTLGVVVIEAAQKSGALITASLALDQGRDVFAVPGNVNREQSRGCNQLLKQGAILVETGWDVLQEYQVMFPQKISNRPGGGQLTLNQAELALSQEQTGEEPAPEPENTELPAESAPAEKPEVDSGENGAYIDLQELKNSRSQDQIQILMSLLSGPALADEIVETTRLATSCVNAALSLLEVDGLVEKLPGRRYRLLVQLRTEE